MPVKRHHQPDRLVLFGVAERLPDNLLMPEVHAVKETDGQADLASSRLELLCGLDDSHLLVTSVAWLHELHRALRRVAPK